MVRKANQQGFDLLTIHDAFFASPNHMQKVRQNYVEILARLASMDLLGDIFSKLIGEPVKYKKLSKDLSKDILESEYALS